MSGYNNFECYKYDLRVLCMRFACKRSPPKSHDIDLESELLGV